MHIGKCRKKDVMIFKKNKDIIFFSLLKNLEKDPLLTPRLYRNIIPEWWNNVPVKSFNSDLNKEDLTIRICPGINDLFSNLIVMPMWLSGQIKVNDKNIDFINLSDKYGSLPLDLHPKFQLLDHADIKVGDRKVTHTIKVNTPWSIITPKGYSVFILPPLYNFNQNFTPMSGVVDTDIHHEINVPSLIHSNEESFSFKYGEPFITILPFKRTKYNMKIADSMSNINKKIIEAIDRFEYYGSDSGSYRKMQRDRDNNIRYNDKWIDGAVI